MVLGWIGATVTVGIWISRKAASYTLSIHSTHETDSPGLLPKGLGPPIELVRSKLLQGISTKYPDLHVKTLTRQHTAPFLRPALPLLLPDLHKMRLHLPLLSNFLALQNSKMVSLHHLHRSGLLPLRIHRSRCRLLYPEAWQRVDCVECAHVQQLHSPRPNHWCHQRGCRCCSFRHSALRDLDAQIEQSKEMVFARHLHDWLLVRTQSSLEGQATR